jgi:hypothetical protein
MDWTKMHVLLGVRGIVVLSSAGAMALSHLESFQTGDSPPSTTFYSIGISGFLNVGKAAGK